MFSYLDRDLYRKFAVLYFVVIGSISVSLISITSYPHDLILIL